MHAFWMYTQIGFNHIANLSGMDHILFVAALCIRYQLSDWKKWLVLITAFTIGHSITLILSVFNYLDFSTAWIEFLIPITILITSINNMFVKQFSFKTRFPVIYFFALFFGLIHGLGFSFYLKSLLGLQQNIAPALLAFNLGLEIGQILIVMAILVISFIFVSLLRAPRRDFVLIVSGGIFALSLQMAIERYFNL
ncbi:MAG: HupE/UreJ family protein [Bacteroidetes bacterium]|jgi:HupE / UreJ protein|nr:HupE/UreJ family protein [Bacteroidota bacterium]